MAKEHADYSNFKNVSVPVGKENRVDATKAILKEQYETIQPKFRYRYLQESLPSQFQSFEREPSPLESTEDFDEIFSGTRTPLDPFCSVQENPPKVENGQIIDYFDDGNILDLVVDADGMIKSKYHVKNSQHKFIFNN